MKRKQFSMLNGSETVDGFIDIPLNAFIISWKGGWDKHPQKVGAPSVVYLPSSSKVPKKV